MTTKIKSTNTDFGSETDSIVLPKGLTAERVSTTIGAFRFNTSTGVIEVYDGNAWMGLSSLPTVTAISPTNVDSKDSATTTTFTVTGTNFTSGATAVLVSNSGSEISFNTVTRDSATQLTCVLNNALITAVTDEPYDIKVTNAAGSGTLTNQVNVDQRPVFVTAAGSLGDITEGASASFTIEATDPESAGAVRFDLVAGTLPSGLSLNTATGAITGTAPAVASDTTSTFTVQASDVDSNVSLREFSITVQNESFQTFTSSGTFSVPVGKTSVDVLVVAGGGGGSSVSTLPRFAAGAGAGGLIFRPAFPVTPGGTISVTVGCGGASDTSGQDSVFGTLTAKGGGGGGADGGSSSPGGSGGGNPATGSGSGSATQPTQPGDSGTYGFGNAGGDRGGPVPAAGGGGGAGATGIAGGSSQGWNYVGEQYPSGTNPSFPNPAANNQPGGDGGIGRAYTIADGTTPVYYAGGGGGGGILSHCFQYNPQGGLGGGGSGSHITFPGNGGPGGAGAANKGGGGGGASKGAAFQPGTTNPGGAGGKGVVIVKY
jgi:hypothetical protein